MPIFDQASLARQVDTALREIPTGRRHALIAQASMDGGVEFRFAERLGRGWSVGAVVRREPTGDWEGGVRVVGTW